MADAKFCKSLSEVMGTEKWQRGRVKKVKRKRWNRVAGKESKAGNSKDLYK